MIPIGEGAQRCLRCGHDAAFCPVCKGAGEVMVRDERNANRCRRVQEPAEAFDAPAACQHCDGTGKHVCIEGRCHCGKPSVYYDPDSAELLCGACAAEAVGVELARALDADWLKVDGRPVSFDRLLTSEVDNFGLHKSRSKEDIGD